MNWLAIAVAAVAYFMLGALWYSLLFKEQWVKATGINMTNPDAKKGAGGIMIFTFILELINCIAIGILVYKLMLIGGVISGIKLGLLTGGAIAATSLLISYVYEGKARSLGLINAGYHIVGNIIAAIIICLW